MCSSDLALIVNQRFKKVNKRLDKVELRLDNIEKDVAEIKNCPTIKAELNL